MRARRQQSGSVIVGILLAVIVLAVIGFVGWRVYQQHHSKTGTVANTSNSSEPTLANDVSTAPAVNSTSDLDKSLGTLDQNDSASADNSDSSQLDGLASF